MRDEKKMILQMIEEGKITAEEGIKLLDALERTTISEEGSFSQTDSQTDDNGATWSDHEDQGNENPGEEQGNYEWKKEFRKSKKDDFGLDDMVRDIGSKAEKFTKEFVSQGKNVTNRLSDVVEKFITKVKDLDFDFDFDFPLGNSVRVDKVFTGITPSKGLIELATVNGRIEVIGWDKSEYRIEVKGLIRGENETEAKAILNEILRFEEEEERLCLLVDRRRGTKVSLDVFLPKRLLSELSLITSNGSIELEDIELKEAKVETYNGAISFEECKGENVFCITSNGKITMEKTELEELYAKSSNGAIRFNGAVQKAKIRTSNGGIRYQLTKPMEGYLDLKTTNGPIEVRLPSEGLKVRGEMSTTFGHLECTLPRVEIISASKEIVNRNLRFRSTDEDGKPYDLVCKTSNGTIRVHGLEE